MVLLSETLYMAPRISPPLMLFSSAWCPELRSKQSYCRTQLLCSPVTLVNYIRQVRASLKKPAMLGSFTSWTLTCDFYSLRSRASFDLPKSLTAGLQEVLTGAPPPITGWGNPPLGRVTTTFWGLSMVLFVVVVAIGTGTFTGFVYTFFFLLPQHISNNTNKNYIFNPYHYHIIRRRLYAF